MLDGDRQVTEGGRQESGLVIALLVFLLAQGPVRGEDGHPAAQEADGFLFGEGMTSMLSASM